MSTSWCVKFLVASKPAEIPGGVAGIAKKYLAHIIVDAVDLVAQAVEMLHGFRANEPAGTGNQNCLWLHLKGLLLPIEVGRASILCVRFREFVSMVVPNR